MSDQHAFGDAIAFLLLGIVSAVACCHSAHAAPLTESTATEIPEWYIAPRQPKPADCEPRDEEGGRLSMRAECADWLLLQAEENAALRRMQAEMARWIAVVVPALDGQLQARGDALKACRKGRAGDKVLTAGAGAAIGLGICVAVDRE